MAEAGDGDKRKVSTAPVVEAYVLNFQREDAAVQALEDAVKAIERESADSLRAVQRLLRSRRQTRAEARRMLKSVLKHEEENP